MQIYGKETGYWNISFLIWVPGQQNLFWDQDGNDSGLCIYRGGMSGNNWGCCYSQQGPGPRLNIKTVLFTYGDFHVKDKTAVRTSYL